MEQDDKVDVSGKADLHKAFGLLWPDSNATIHKDKLLEFFKSILGALYSEDMANCLIDIMTPDEEGNITMDNFVHAFSLAYWTPESVAAMHNVLVTNPDIISKLANWKEVLHNFGMDISDTEVNAIIQEAQTRATALLTAELSRSASYSVEDKEEVYRKSGEILNSIRAKLSGMDIQALSDAALGESTSTDPSDRAEEDAPIPERLEAYSIEEEAFRKSDDILNSIRAKLTGGIDIQVTSDAGSGESGSTDPSNGAGSVEEGATSHPESPLFPSVPDKLEAQEQKGNDTELTKTD